VCDLKNLDPPFPKNELTKVETTALQCIETITSEKVQNIFKLHIFIHFIILSF